MDARERLLAVFHGEEPDKIPVWAADQLRAGPQGGWARRLTKRGMGIRRIAFPYKPVFLPPFSIPLFEDLQYTRTRFLDKGVEKNHHRIDTPIGSISCIDTFGLDGPASNTTEYFIKKPADWRVINYIFENILRVLAPDYVNCEREEDDLGGEGLTVVFIDKTPFQRAWTELASIERAFIDYKDGVEDFMIFLDLQRRLHLQIAQIAAEAPAEVILINDNITNVISPALYREFCQPYYEIYHEALTGSGKVLAVHMDGSLAHLRDEIAGSAFNVVDSLTVPPTGNVSLQEARACWPGKIVTINCPPHLAWAEVEQVREGYLKIAQEWGDKRIVIVHVEDLPLERVELHLGAALDAYGYP